LLSISGSGGTPPTSGVGLRFVSNRLLIYGGSQDITFQKNSNASSNMVILESGNVGIGTTSPSTLFHVNTARSSGADVNIMTLSDNVAGVQTSGFGVRILATSNSGQAKSAIAFEANGGTNNDTAIAFYTQTSAASLDRRMTINKNGNVGIGTSSPTERLHIVGDAFAGIKINDGTNTAILQFHTSDGFRIVTATAKPIVFFSNDTDRMRIYSTGGLNILTSTGDGFCIQFNSGFKLRADSATQLGIVNSAITDYADLRVKNMTKASGTFRISHPLESLSETHDLVHSFIEGPRADLIYRGKVTLINGTATINIDTSAGMTEGTFVALNRDIQCFTTNESGWDLVKGKVEGNILTITSQNTESTDEISWMVVGERQDKHIKDTDWTDENGKPILEPLKTL